MFLLLSCPVGRRQPERIVGSALALAPACLAWPPSKEKPDRAAVFETNSPSSCLSTVSERKFYSLLNWILSCCKLSLLPLFREWNYNSLSLKFTGVPFLGETRNCLLELEFSLHLCLPVHRSFSDSPKLSVSFNELVQNRFLCHLRKQFPSVRILLTSNGFLFKKI